MWEISLNHQVTTVLLSLFMGAVFYIIYDTFKAIRQFFVLRSMGVFICDITFFMLISLIEFCFLLSRCNGEIRGFVLIVQLVGFFICRVTISRLYLKILMMLLKGAGIVIRLLNALLCKTYNLSATFLKKAYKKIQNFLKNRVFLRKKG